MKPRLSTLFLLLSLFVALSANCAWACSDTDGEHEAKFHHRHDSATQEPETVEVSGHCNEHHPGKPYSDDQSGHCHCPGCGTVGHTPTAFAPIDGMIPNQLLFDASVQRQAFYFAEQPPEAVYLPIWQPPKLPA